MSRLLQLWGSLALLLLQRVQLSSSQGSAVAAPSAEELAAFRADLKVAFVADDDGPGSSAGGPAMMRSLVRLGFHDCASESCDGCIDVDDTAQNAGLPAIVEALTPICITHQLGMADCFAAAASIAVEETSSQGATLAQVPLFFGREDAATCGGFTNQSPEGTFPSGQDGYNPTFSYFEDAFGFTQRETVAIMGAHSLGRAEPQGSGFNGSWTNSTNAFDNAFYTDMLDGALGWEAGQTDGGNTPLWQWTSSNDTMMLNSDMAIVMDVFDGSDRNSGQPSCTFSTCPPSPTLPIVQEFAADNALFVSEFTGAFVKMLTRGYDVCDLNVVPSEGSGAEVESVYGISAIKEGCGVPVLAAEALGPAPSGVLEPSAATPATAAAAPVAVVEEEWPANSPADGGLESPASAALDGGSGGDASGAPGAPASADGATRSSTVATGASDVDGEAAAPVGEEQAGAASTTSTAYARQPLMALVLAATGYLLQR